MHIKKIATLETAAAAAENIKDSHQAIASDDSANVGDCG